MLVNVRIEGDSAYFKTLYACLFQRLPIPVHVVDVFEQTGRIELDARLKGRLVDEVVCTCLEVPESRIRQVIRTYESSADEFEDMLGCGSVCGGCRPDIEDMVDDYAASRKRAE